MKNAPNTVAPIPVSPVIERPKVQPTPYKMDIDEDWRKGIQSCDFLSVLRTAIVTAIKKIQPQRIATVKGAAIPT